MRTYPALCLGGCLLGSLLPDGAAAIRRQGVPTNTFVRINAERKIATLPPSAHLIADDERHQPIACRGGACSDSNPALFAKVFLSAAVETGLMYSFITYAAKVNTMDYSKVVTRSIQVVLLLAVIFGSASFGAIIDNGLSAASKQALNPNEIPGDADWYANLKKPSWNPPGWVFPIMWLIVSKPTQFAAVWKLITQSYEKDLTIPLAVYCGHLSLGDAWNKVFFGLECVGRGVAVISTFWSMLLLSVLLFYNVDQYAGLLLVPTFLWVTVAATLNWSIYLLNKDGCDA